MTIEQKDKTSGEILKDLFTAGSILLGSYFAKNQIEQAIVNNNRKETALEEFDRQDLSWWDREQLKAFFKDHDFYVTKFPHTPKEIFPLAVKVLYLLIKFHNKSYPDSGLGSDILINCEKLHRIAVQKHFSPINHDWEYWKLIQHEVSKRDFWGQLKLKREYFVNPSWNLEEFLNTYEGGVVRFGLFGVEDKRIDFCYYRKTWFGKLVDRQEVDENEKTLATVWKVMHDSHYVAVIYDPKFGFNYQNEENFDGTITNVTNIRDGQVFTQRDIKYGHIRIYRNVEVSRAQFNNPHWPDIQDQISWGSLMDDGTKDDSKPYIYFDDGLPQGLSVNVNPKNCPKLAGRYYKTIRINEIPNTLVVVQSTADGDTGHFVIWPSGSKSEDIPNGSIAKTLVKPEITKKNYYKDRLSLMGYKFQSNL